MLFVRCYLVGLDLRVPDLPVVGWDGFAFVWLAVGFGGFTGTCARLAVVFAHASFSVVGFAWAGFGAGFALPGWRLTRRQPVTAKL